MRFLLAIAWAAALAARLAAQEPTVVRLVKDEKGRATAMETAIVRYERGAGKEKVTIEAVGAVHLGDAAYYKTLNERFKGYDALCYELVTSEDAAPAEGTDFYGLAGAILGLEGQLSAIDYKAKNFVHADMTMEAIRKKMEERGDDAVTIALSALADGLRSRNLAEKRKRDKGEAAAAEPTLEELLSGPVELKRYLAEGMVSSVNGPGLGAGLNEYLIKDRNEAAMKVVDEQIKKGHTKLGLFYGAAHLPDFHKRLTERGFTAAETTWTKAWDLSKPHSWDLLAILQKLLR